MLEARNDAVKGGIRWILGKIQHNVNGGLPKAPSPNHEENDGGDVRPGALQNKGQHAVSCCIIMAGTNDLAQNFATDEVRAHRPSPVSSFLFPLSCPSPS